MQLSPPIYNVIYMEQSNIIKKQRHQGLQVKHVLELFNVPVETLITGLNLTQSDILGIFSSSVVKEELLNKIASFLNIPVDVIKNLNDEVSFSTTILSENNTIINYNYCINQNSIENISKIYEIVRDLVKKEQEPKSD